MQVFLLSQPGITCEPTYNSPCFSRIKIKVVVTTLYMRTSLHLSIRVQLQVSWDGSYSYSSCGFLVYQLHHLPNGATGHHSPLMTLIVRQQIIISPSSFLFQSFKSIPNFLLYYYLVPSGTK